MQRIDEEIDRLDRRLIELKSPGGQGAQERGPTQCWEYTDDTPERDTKRQLLGGKSLPQKGAEGFFNQNDLSSILERMIVRTRIDHLKNGNIAHRKGGLAITEIVVPLPQKPAVKPKRLDHRNPRI